jgi:hypothetical protein
MLRCKRCSITYKIQWVIYLSINITRIIDKLVLCLDDSRIRMKSIMCEVKEKCIQGVEKLEGKRPH